MKKHLVRFLEFDEKRVDRNISKRINVYYHLYLGSPVSWYTRMFGLCSYFEKFTGYFIDEKKFINSFREKTLFKRVKNYSKNQNYFRQIGPTNTLLKFTFNVELSKNTPNEDPLKKAEILKKITLKIENEFWKFARNSITLMRFDNPTIDINAAIKIFYKAIKLTEDEYDLGSFKRMLYKHEFKVLKLNTVEGGHFLKALSNSFYVIYKND